MSAWALTPSSGTPPGVVFAGKIARYDAATGLVGVTIDAYGDEHEWPPAVWVAAGQTPHRGDRVLVLIDDKGEVWALPSRVSVVNEALPYTLLDTSLFAGANIDAALADAKTRAGVSGGRIVIPRGALEFLNPPSFAATNDTVLEGAGGVTAGAAAATHLLYKGTGARAIDARSSFGFGIRDMQILYDQAGFTGTLIDFSHSIVQDAAGMTITNVYLGGSGVRGATFLVDLSQAICGSFKAVTFAGAGFAVRGLAAAPDANNYSNAHTFDSCIFKDQTVQHILSPHEAWTFLNPTVERLVTALGVAAGAGFITYGAGAAAENVTILGGWMGDANTTGDWINFLGKGLTIIGTHFGGGNIGVRLDAGGIDGVVIKGARFDGQATAGGALAGTGNKNWDLTSNHIAGGTPALWSVGGTFPANSRVQDRSGAGAFVYNSETPIFATAVSDASFTLTPVDGMTALEDVAGVRKWCSRIGGIWYKVTLT